MKNSSLILAALLLQIATLHAGPPGADINEAQEVVYLLEKGENSGALLLRVPSNQSEECAYTLYFESLSGNSGDVLLRIPNILEIRGNSSGEWVLSGMLPQDEKEFGEQQILGVELSYKSSGLLTITVNGIIEHDFHWPDDTSELNLEFYAQTTTDLAIVANSADNSVPPNFSPQKLDTSLSVSKSVSEPEKNTLLNLDAEALKFAQKFGMPPTSGTRPQPDFSARSQILMPPDVLEIHYKRIDGSNHIFNPKAHESE